MEFKCACWRKPLTRSHRPWPCYSTNLCNSAFFQKTGNSRILYPFLRKEKETLWSERCVLAGLRDHIFHLFSREQHGFLAGRSCVTQLTSVLHYIGGQLDAGKQIGIIFLDMSKAFDKVITPSYLEGCTNTVLLTNSTTGSVHTYRGASNSLQFSELFPENCRLHPGYHKGPY